MNTVFGNPARHALWLCLLGMACFGAATPAWATQCEEGNRACAPSSPAPAATPDARALLEARSRSRMAHAQPPRLKRVPPQTEPNFWPEPFHDPRTTKRRTPTIPPFAPQQDHTECDIEGFATKSGQALSDHIRAMTYRCFDALFSDAPLQLRLAAFQRRNMIDIAQATVQLMAAYEGVNTDHLYSKHYLFLRVGYYNLFELADEMDWGDGSARTVVAEAVIEAVDAFVENDHFLDHTETHCETAWEIYAMIEGADFGPHLVRYLPAFKSWLKALGRDHVDLDEVVAATNGIFSVLDQAHLAPSFVAAATTDTDLVATLRNLALLDYMLGTTAELLLGNAGYSLAQFVQYDAAPIYPDVVAGVRTILNHYDRTSEEIGVWLETARIVSYYGKCAEFDICGFERDLEAQVLSVSHVCSAVDVRIRGQDLTAQDLATACSSLANINDRFHALLNTGRTPVADDHNAHLEIIVYADWDNYDTYSGLFFGNDTDNGGIYFEGDPADEDNVARFFVYVRRLPERRIWNLEHEYVHYLDGRFNLYGGFDDSHMQLWWAEGLAEYVSLGNANERAIEIARGSVLMLNDLFPTTYDHGADRVYRWTYLAIRFLFEHHADHIGRITGYLRANCLDEYQDYLKDRIGNRHDDEWLDWLGSVAATSEFATNRGVRSHRLNCGIHSGSNVDTGSRMRSHVRQVEIFPLGESTIVDVTDYFRGFGADAVFSVTSADPNVVAATLDGRVLTLLAVSAGEAVVSITANEGDRSVTRTLLVEIAEECPAYACRSWTGWRLQILLDSLKPPGD